MSKSAFHAHEAGHVIWAFLRGSESVSVHTDGEGFTVITPEEPPTDLFEIAAGLLAGPVAEMLHLHPAADAAEFMSDIDELYGGPLGYMRRSEICASDLELLSMFCVELMMEAYEKVVATLFILSQDLEAATPIVGRAIEVARGGEMVQLNCIDLLPWLFKLPASLEPAPILH